MCLRPIKIQPRRYYSDVEVKGKIYTSLKYDGEIYSSSQKYQYYPCGKCIKCRSNQVEAWSIRWKEEIKNSVVDSSYLVTLTYNDQHLPHLNGVSVLRYSDVQKFLKKVRKLQEKIYPKMSKIVYHYCGEYGKQYTKRPHYHMLITGLLLSPEELQSKWIHGHIHVGNDVSDKTIKYVLKYSLKNSLVNQKKSRVEDSDGKYLYHVIGPNQENSGRIAEHSFCSKSIGKCFLTKDIIKQYRANPGLNYLDFDEKKQVFKSRPLPRYYKELIFNPNRYNLRIVNGELIKTTIMRDDDGRPLKEYCPKDEDYFRTTPRYNRLKHLYVQNNQSLKIVYDMVKHHGYNEYLAIYLRSNVHYETNARVNLNNAEKIRLYNQRMQGALLF